MPRRKPAPAPKRKAARKSAPAKAKPKSALTKGQQDYARFTEAANAATQAALAPVMAQLAQVSSQINARHRERLKDITATLRALAEQPAEYAVVMPRAERAAIAHNLSAARVESPNLVKAGRAVQMGVDTYRDYLELPARYLYSPEAERLLSVLTGKWRTAYRAADCNADTGRHAAECAHNERRLVVSKSSLARELHGSAGGSQIAMVSRCLRELATARHTYTRARETGAGEVQVLSGADGEPILSYLRAGTGETLESAAASRTLTLQLGEKYHEQIMRGLYRVERTERLTCWRESWELELMLRLITTPATRYGSYAMNNSRDGLSVRLLLSRTDETTELGSVSSLLSGSRSLRSPAATLKRLQRFAEQLRAVSLPDELQIAMVQPKTEGSRVVGWYLGLGYPEQPLTAGQAKRLAKAARTRLRGGQEPTPLQRRGLARVRAYPQDEAAKAAQELHYLEQALAAVSAPKHGTKRTNSRHEVPQITHETGGRLVLDSLLDSTKAKAVESTEERTPSEVKAERIATLRASWDSYPHETRRILQRTHPELRDLPA
jgi:truncated hemoglobin YjbI